MHHILCGNPFIPRDFYAIRPPHFMAYFGSIFFANMGGGGGQNYLHFPDFVWGFVIGSFSGCSSFSASPTENRQSPNLIIPKKAQKKKGPIHILPTNQFINPICHDMGPGVVVDLTFFFRRKTGQIHQRRGEVYKPVRGRYVDRPLFFGG